mmetsp:Transcript_114546/g.160861  ORF Transcript_114546/g.160861 Transcript_114546/m.160861 type:complete len:334 (+) Transcript_114546:49-1050(+)
MAGVRQAPGGASSICLGLDDSEKAKISSNAFASNACQNSGNVLTERPTTLLLAPPGGRSTICLGESPKAVKLAAGEKPGCLGDSHTAPSSNAFACGMNQNCGNVLSERPTILLHAPPGGRSTICLGHDGGYVSKSESRPVGGEDHISWGEPLPQSITSHRVPAGGKSTICLGVDSVDFVSVSETGTGTAGATEVDTTQESELLAAGAYHRDASQFTSRVPAGGASSVCLGTDISEWCLSSRALGRSKAPLEEIAKCEATVAQDAEDQLKEDKSVDIVEAHTTQTEGVTLGVETEVCEEKDMSKSKTQEVNALQDLPTPARRAPPGGVATVLLG